MAPGRQPADQASACIVMKGRLGPGGSPPRRPPVPSHAVGREPLPGNRLVRPLAPLPKSEEIGRFATRPVIRYRTFQ
jgi:hypothetical protein